MEIKLISSVDQLMPTEDDMFYLLEKLVDALPKTKDGYCILIGVTVKCPKGHEHTYEPFHKMSGRVYCCKAECWSEGCQSDSGSGTYYEADECTFVSGLK